MGESLSAGPSCCSSGDCDCRVQEAGQLTSVGEHLPEAEVCHAVGGGVDDPSVGLERRFLVVLTKETPGDSVGVDVRHLLLGQLIISRIDEGGLVAKWNEERLRAGSHGSVVHVGDAIVRVNAVEGEDDAMVREVLSSHCLDLLIDPGPRNSRAFPGDLAPGSSSEQPIWSDEGPPAQRLRGVGPQRMRGNFPAAGSHADGSQAPPGTPRGSAPQASRRAEVAGPVEPRRATKVTFADEVAAGA